MEQTRKILNFGSLNTDYVYKVDHILQGGETIQSESRTVFPGGKGLNQSIALARAGLSVCHAGLIGTDGGHLRDLLNQNGVDTSLIEARDMPGGHTVIQVSRDAQNAILLYGGANQAVDEDYVDRVLSHFSSGDLILLQNEISALPYILKKAHERGMEIWLNPSPMNENILKCDLSLVSVFVLNEVEGEQLTGTKIPTKISDTLLQKYPGAAVVLTLGRMGAWYAKEDKRAFAPAELVRAVDTTAAGDTFTGYFVRGILSGLSPKKSLTLASKAAAIAVSRPGAAPSIPLYTEVTNERI